MNKWALSLLYTIKTRGHGHCHIRTDLRSFTEIFVRNDMHLCYSDTLVLQYSLQASIAELASISATDVGIMVYCSQSDSVLPPVHCGPVA